MSKVPTPGEFAQALAEMYAETASPLDGGYCPSDMAKRRLVLQAVAEVFGPNDPLSEFVRAYEKAEIAAFPANLTEDDAHTIWQSLDDMRNAWEIIEQDFIYTAEGIIE